MLNQIRSAEDDEHLVLGRSLMDRGFRHLFLHDPERASALLKVPLSAEAVRRIQARLAQIAAMPDSERARFTSAVNALERWKQ